MPSVRKLNIFGKVSQAAILSEIGSLGYGGKIGYLLIEGLEDDVGQIILKAVKQKFPEVVCQVRENIVGSNKFEAWVADPNQNKKQLGGLYCVKQKAPSLTVVDPKPIVVAPNPDTKIVNQSEIETVPPRRVDPPVDDDVGSGVRIMETSFGLRYSIINDSKLKFCLPQQNVPKDDKLNEFCPEVYFQSDDVLAYAGTKQFALVNAVNCSGIMGAGMAKQFKEAMPKEYYEDYKNYCNWWKDNKAKAPGFGFCHLVIMNGLYVFGLPTKLHPDDELNIELYKGGLRSLLHLLMEAEEHTGVKPWVLIPKRLGNGLARPKKMNDVECNVHLERATAEVVEQFGGILNVEKLLWLDELNSNLMPDPSLRVINISMHTKMLRDTFRFNLPEDFTRSWKIGAFDMINSLGGQYLVAQPDGGSCMMGLNYWSEDFGIPEIEPEEVYNILSNKPQAYLSSYELEALQILKWVRWLKNNVNEKLVVMTDNFGKYRWLMAEDKMISGYACRSLLDLSIRKKLIEKLWVELRSVRERIWFTFNIYWTGAIIREAIEKSNITWEEDRNGSGMRRDMICGLCNTYVNNDGSTKARESQLTRNRILICPADKGDETAYKMYHKGFYYTGPTNWSSGAGWIGKPSWVKSQKDFEEVKAFNNKNLFRKEYTI